MSRDYNINHEQFVRCMGEAGHQIDANTIICFKTTFHEFFVNFTMLGMVSVEIGNECVEIGNGREAAEIVLRLLRSYAEIDQILGGGGSAAFQDVG